MRDKGKEEGMVLYLINGHLAESVQEWELCWLHDYQLGGGARGYGVQEHSTSAAGVGGDSSPSVFACVWVSNEQLGPAKPEH